MKIITSTNPAKNYEKVGELKASTREEILEAVRKANQAKESWGEMPIQERIVWLKKAMVAFQNRQSDIVDLINQEIGTPVSDVDDEVSWNWSYWNWFLENVESALSPIITVKSATSVHEVHYEPIGSVAVITPWNLPFDLFVWGVVPNLLAGNVVMYKAAEECVLSGKLYADIMTSIRLPEGVFQAIHGDAEEGKILTESPIDSIWFTGSSEVGKKLYELAGRKFIRATLEMGGSNPAIVCMDADLDLAATKIVAKRFMFSGQTCDADKRLIVHTGVKEELLRRIVDKVKVREVTPLVSQKQLTILAGQVNDAVAKGAKIVIGGSISPDKKGAYYQPTIIDDVTRDMKVWNEEVFGPVLPVISFDTDEEALELANGTEYGLGSQLFTKDVNKIEHFSRKLKAGNVDVNGVGHFIPQNPFGGYKNSGMGREHGIGGFRELCQMKTVSRLK